MSERKKLYESKDIAAIWDVIKRIRKDVKQLPKDARKTVNPKLDTMYDSIAKFEDEYNKVFSKVRIGEAYSAHLDTENERMKELAGVIREGEPRLTTPEKHQKKVALDTLKMNDAGAAVMGGMDKPAAKKFLKSIGYTDAQIKKAEK